MYYYRRRRCVMKRILVTVLIVFISMFTFSAPVASIPAVPTSAGTTYTPFTSGAIKIIIKRKQSKTITVPDLPANTTTVKVLLKTKPATATRLTIISKGSVSKTVLRLSSNKKFSKVINLKTTSSKQWLLKTSSKKKLKISFKIIATQNTTPIIPPSDVSDLPDSPVVPDIPIDLTQDRYPIGTPSLTNIWVSPTGSNSNTGNTRSSPLQTLTAAWARIPVNTPLTTGYRIQLLPGNYSEGTTPNYWENRQGSYTNPIILNAPDGLNTVTVEDDINMYNTTYFYVTDIVFETDTDVFHCEKCSHILIKNSVLNGDITPSGGQAHETIKVNQSDHVFVEDSVISGADDNALDFVAVQYGHLKGNKISEAGDWCAYVKGGSAYLKVEGNEFFNCGTGGFTAGQGTGLEFMTPPWVTYEAIDIKIVNNIVHDTQGAGFGVNGGYNILVAYNTTYRTGSRSHIFEAVFGLRSCDGNTSECLLIRSQGGWGPTGSEEVVIPNRNVFVYNNVFYNPAGFASAWQHFAVANPVTQSSVFNVPNPAAADTNLRIEGNIIFNGTPSMPLGVGDGSCGSSHPTCSETILRANNVFNETAPNFVNVNTNDFRPVPSSWLTQTPTVTIPSFSYSDISPIPTGTTSNNVLVDKTGHIRETTTPGALLP